MIMKDLIELLCTVGEINKEHGKQCCIERSAEIEVQNIIFYNKYTWSVCTFIV